MMDTVHRPIHIRWGMSADGRGWSLCGRVVHYHDCMDIVPADAIAPDDRCGECMAMLTELRRYVSARHHGMREPLGILQFADPDDLPF